MNVFPIEPKFPIGEVGFKGTYKDDQGQERPLDLLGRADFGQRLTDLLDRTEQPLVIALDGPWGSGKSHFLKLWAGAHKLELGGKAEVIYFDAFEHDFLDDPLVSLIGRLADDPTLSAQNPSKLKALKKVAIPIARAAIKAGFALAAFGATNYLGDALDKAAEAAGTSAADSSVAAADEFWKQESGRLAAMTQFREGLSELTHKEDGTTQKIVFIIDELDRCRPDYALQLLEIIKHFFTVPNVHFVLGANLSELENSVKARYGAGINARKYLQKFVMLEMRLPSVVSSYGRAKPVAEDYFEQLKDYYIIDRDRHHYIEKYIQLIQKSNIISIRDLQRILSLISLFPRYIKNESFATDGVCISIAFLFVLKNDIYQEIRQGTAKFQDIQSFLNLRKVDEDHFSAGMMENFTYFFKIDKDMETAKPSIQNDSAYKHSLHRVYGSSPENLLEKVLSRYFDTFTLPAP